jgi:hypothetical protein
VTAAVVLDGPSLTGEECLMLVREVAPLVIGRPLALQEVERQTLADLDGRGACWSVVLRDGDVELRAGVFNGEGNPRDGYGYGLSAKLLIPGVDGASGWRAELYGGGWEPVLAGPIRLYVIGLSPETFEAVRARVRALLPRHRDITFDDAYTVRSLVSDFDRHGHVAWVKDFLAQPLRQGLPWLTAELCERKIALHGPDPETARAWLGFEPYASLAWTALADAGGDASTREGEARLLAALTNPFSPGLVEAASKAYPIEAEALAGAMAHVYRDAAWRWLDASERDAFEARAHAWEPSTSTEVRWARPGHVASNAVEREIAALLLEGAAALENAAEQVEAVDAGGALVDAVQFLVAQPGLGQVLARVAVAAVDLQGEGVGLEAALGGEALGDGGEDVEEALVVAALVGVGVVLGAVGVAGGLQEGESRPRRSPSGAGACAGRRGARRSASWRCEDRERRGGGPGGARGRSEASW